MRYTFTRRENSTDRCTHRPCSRRIDGRHANARTADCSPQPQLEGHVMESLLFFQKLYTSFRTHRNKLLSFIFETRLMDCPIFLPSFSKLNIKMYPFNDIVVSSIETPFH